MNTGTAATGLLVLLVISISSAAAEDKVTTLASIDRGRTVPEIPAAALPPKVTERYEYYEVCGCSEHELQCDLQKNCVRGNDGHKYDSLTRWEVRWDHAYDRTAESCAVSSFRPVVDITFRYPRWKRTANAPGPLVEKWERYLANLVIHEKGHRDRAVEAAAELSRAVAQLPPAPTCANLDRSVMALFRTRMAQMKHDQREYDEATGHGAAQGAVFP